MRRFLIQVLLLIAHCACGVAQTKPTNADTKGHRQQIPPLISPSRAIHIIRPSIVQISMAFKYSIAGQPSAVSGNLVLGSGFFADTVGHVFTAKHVIDDFRSAPDLITKTLLDRKRSVVIPESWTTELFVNLALPDTDYSFDNYVGVRAKEAKNDPTQDVSLLELGTNPFSANLGARFVIDGIKAVIEPRVPSFDSSRPIDGEMISVSGYPFGVPSLVTTNGFIAAHWFFEPQLRQMVYLGDIQVNRGNSGGPAYRTKDGTVIGIVTAYRNTEENYNSGLAIIVPIQRALDFLKK